MHRPNSYEEQLFVDSFFDVFFDVNNEHAIFDERYFENSEEWEYTEWETEEEVLY